MTFHLNLEMIAKLISNVNYNIFISNLEHNEKWNLQIKLIYIWNTVKMKQCLFT